MQIFTTLTLYLIRDSRIVYIGTGANPTTFEFSTTAFLKVEEMFLGFFQNALGYA
jgi:hypothetical protein